MTFALLSRTVASWLAKLVFCRENAQTFFRQKVINGNIGVFSSRLLDMAVKVVEFLSGGVQNYKDFCIRINIL